MSGLLPFLVQASPADREADGSENGFLRVFNFRVILSGMLCFWGTLVFGVIEPSLAEHLVTKTGISQTGVGMVFSGVLRPWRHWYGR